MRDLDWKGVPRKTKMGGYLRVAKLESASA